MSNKTFKKFIAFAVLALGVIGFQSFASADSVAPISPFTVTSTPSQSITQRVASTPVQITGLIINRCVQTDGSGFLISASSTCGTGSGGVVSIISSNGSITYSTSSGNIDSNINLAHVNNWSAVQNFVNATFSNTATTTVLVITGVQSSVLATDANGKVIATSTPTFDHVLTFSTTSTSTFPNLSSSNAIISNSFGLPFVAGTTTCIEADGSGNIHGTGSPCGNSSTTPAIVEIGPLGQYASGAVITLATSTTGTDFTITGTSSTITFNLPFANGVTNGKLSSNDYTTFSNKVGPTRTINTTAPLQGGANLSADLTLSITQAGGSTNGYLSSTDWNTFNGKQNALSFPLSVTLGGSGSNGFSPGGFLYATGTSAFVASSSPTFTNLYITATTTSNNFLDQTITGTTSCVYADSNGLFHGTAQPCGSAAVTGSVNTGTAGQVGYYATNGNAISGENTGNLTDAGTDGITITGGTGAVIGSGSSLSQHVGDATHNGYISSTDWGTFNGKQSALSFPLTVTTYGGIGTTTLYGPGLVFGSTTNALIATTSYSLPFTFNNSLNLPFADAATSSCLYVTTSGVVTGLGSPCGTGNGSGTVNPGVAGSPIAYYPSSAAAVSPTTTIVVSNPTTIGLASTSPTTGNVDVGVNLGVANSITQYSSTATSTFNGYLVWGSNSGLFDPTTGTTTISNLQSGTITFDNNAGQVTAMNMTLLTAATGTQEAYSFQVANSSIATIYAENNGSGVAQNMRFGIGTTTPLSTLVVQPANTSDKGLEIDSSTGVNEFVVDKNGHRITGGTSPSVSSCGSSPTITGNDNAGRVIVGSGVVTSCTVTFGKAWTTNAPACLVNQENGTFASPEASSTLTTAVITTATTMGGDAITYTCTGF